MNKWDTLIRKKTEKDQEKSTDETDEISSKRETDSSKRTS